MQMFHQGSNSSECLLWLNTCSRVSVVIMWNSSEERLRCCGGEEEWEEHFSLKMLGSVPCRLVTSGFSPLYYKQITSLEGQIQSWGRSCGAWTDRRWLHYTTQFRRWTAVPIRHSEAETADCECSPNGLNPHLTAYLSTITLGSLAAPICSWADEPRQTGQEEERCMSGIVKSELSLSGPETGAAAWQQIIWWNDNQQREPRLQVWYVTIYTCLR